MNSALKYDLTVPRHFWFYRDFSENGYFKTLAFDSHFYAARHADGTLEAYGSLDTTALKWFNKLKEVNPDVTLVRRREVLTKLVPVDMFLGTPEGYATQYGVEVIREKHHSVRIFDEFLEARRLLTTTRDSGLNAELYCRSVFVGEWRELSGESFDEYRASVNAWWARFGLTTAQRAPQ